MNGPKRYFACEACGTYFALGDGGVCKACGRMLCDAHLHGRGAWWRRKLLRRPRCVACREGRSATDHGAPGA